MYGVIILSIFSSKNYVIDLFIANYKIRLNYNYFFKNPVNDLNNIRMIHKLY